jgi:hypothetical protein
MPSIGDMSDKIADLDEEFSVCLARLDGLFALAEIDTVLNEPRWAERYPQVMAEWKAQGWQASEELLLPGEVVLAIVRQCTFLGELSADADGQTLYLAGLGDKPFRRPEDAKRISAEEAFTRYGLGTVLVAREIGKARKDLHDGSAHRAAYKKLVLDGYLDALLCMACECRAAGRARDSTKVAKIVVAYNIILELLVATGWDDGLDPEALLPDELIDERYRRAAGC